MRVSIADLTVSGVRAGVSTKIAAVYGLLMVLVGLLKKRMD